MKIKNKKKDLIELKEHERLCQNGHDQIVVVGDQMENGKQWS